VTVTDGDVVVIVVDGVVVGWGVCANPLVVVADGSGLDVSDWGTSGPQPVTSQPATAGTKTNVGTRPCFRFLNMRLLRLASIDVARIRDDPDARHSD